MNWIQIYLHNLSCLHEAKELAIGKKHQTTHCLSMKWKVSGNDYQKKPHRQILYSAYLLITH